MVELHLYFLFDRTHWWKRLEVPFSSYRICNAKDTWAQADTDMKHHVCQLASGSTIRYNLGPQIFQKYREPPQNSRHQKGEMKQVPILRTHKY